VTTFQKNPENGYPGCTTSGKFPIFSLAEATDFATSTGAMSMKLELNSDNDPENCKWTSFVRLSNIISEILTELNKK
jgi:hypothetical protein